MLSCRNMEISIVSVQKSVLISRERAQKYISHIGLVNVMQVKFRMI